MAQAVFRHEFCTYFDSRYLTRGLALLESLRRWSTDVRLHVLCLDDQVEERLSSLADDGLCLLRLTELERIDPELAAVRTDRSPAAYYFTLTGAFCRALFDRHPEIDRLTYLDADLYFFGDPMIVFSEIGDASIAIVPHRFSVRNAFRRRYGLFNVGWLTWRRDEAGLACLDAYRRQCLNWCHDYVDGDRFADQRYLDDWPSRYPNLRVLEHRGINLAPWNLDACALTLRDGEVLVDGAPLVFFHFHRFRLGADGASERNLAEYGVREDGPDRGILDHLYGTYERHLRDLTERHALATGTGSLRGGGEALCPSSWEYRPDGWISDPQLAPGWSKRTALDAMASRVAVARRRVGTVQPIGGDLRVHNEAMTLAYAALRVARGRDRLSILDWGGGLGSLYPALSALLPGITLDYHVKEQAAVAEYGRDLTPEAVFTESDVEAFGQRYDLVIAQAALHHAESWRDVLARLAQVTEGMLALLRVPVVFSVSTFAMLHRDSGSDYRSVYPCWAFNRLEMLELVAKEGLRLDRMLVPSDHPWVEQAPEQPEIWGFLFENPRPAVAVADEGPPVVTP